MMNCPKCKSTIIETYCSRFPICNFHWGEPPEIINPELAELKATYLKKRYNFPKENNMKEKENNVVPMNKVPGFDTAELEKEIQQAPDMRPQQLSEVDNLKLQLAKSKLQNVNYEFKLFVQELFTKYGLTATDSINDSGSFNRSQQ